MRRAALFALFMPACALAELTEVVVIIEAEPRVKMRSESLALRVTTAPRSGPGTIVLDNSNTPWNDGRYTLALSPTNDRDASRYVVEASALEGGVPIARARLISGFVAGETRYVKLLLEDQCVGVLSCDEASTCRSGACVDAELDPTDFAGNDDRAPSTVTLLPARDASVHDAKTSDAPAQADAGVNEVAKDASTALPDAQVANDAGPQQDARAPGACKAGYYEGSWMGEHSYVGLGVVTDTTIAPVSTEPGPVLSLVIGSDGRLGAACVSSTMMAPPSSRPYKARLEGRLDCATGALVGTLYGHYSVAFVRYPFTGTIAAQLEGESLRGSWTAMEPDDPESGSSGAGAGTWSASWQGSAPMSSSDPCADVAAP